MQANCLNCKKKLPLLTHHERGKYSCECGVDIPYTHGIYQFVQKDEFYEGKFIETHQQSGLFEKVFVTIKRTITIDGNEERMWERSKRLINRQTGGKRLEILNLGAGGGHSFLNEIGSVTAVDLSLSSLLNAQKIYEACYQADAREIPFPDGCFDLVFSAHLMGHIPLEHKQEVIHEAYRVTKPGGYLLHSIECEADNFVYREAKKYPALYKKYFVDMFGHYGLELPSLCKKRFRHEGIEVIFENSDYCKGVVRPANSYKVFFGAKEYREMDWRFNALASISEILSSNKYVNFMSGIFLYALTPLNRIGGADAVDSIKLLYRKKGLPPLAHRPPSVQV